MKIIDYFRAEDPSHWLEEMEKSDWDVGKYLSDLLLNDSLKESVGENTRVLLLTEGETLISFCTLAPMDDIQPTDLTPWIGFVYTFPAFRGQGYAEKLMRTRKNWPRRTERPVSTFPPTTWDCMSDTDTRFSA